jgi:8-oxo-dGTP pyrophosphatase MutT (NUDIX family)|tara:strand:- start:4034 stop:4783 length:750 start_codon:yes stop_codon:yes gene_type:complete
MIDQPIRPAATVIIARAAAPQYEILMLRRTNAAVFAGGMYVFPGGKIDEADADPELINFISPLGAPQLRQQIALGDAWQACWVAGIRETFEESGILLAYTADGVLANTQAMNLDQARAEVHDGTLTLKALCAREGLTLAVDQIHYFNRWVTPPGRPRRFDTRFFITSAPLNQLHRHDGAETTESLWISPTKALDRNAQDDFGMMTVTIKQLETLNQYQSLTSLLTMAGGQTDFPYYAPVLPVAPAAGKP